MEQNMPGNNEYESTKSKPPMFGASFAKMWEHYEELRPHYPDRLFDIIAEYMAENNKTNRTLCVDYGSGSGVTVPALLERCGVTKVLATDVNAPQLDAGRAKLIPVYGDERYDTLVGAAGDLDGLSDESVDLVTSSEASHYFDKSRWFEEVARVLKPTGTLAFWYYQPQCFVLSHPEAADACSKAFERLFEIGLPKNTISLETVVHSISLQDSVVVDSDRFTQQVRYKWLLPETVSRMVSRDAELALNDSSFSRDAMRAGLSATQDVVVNTFTPQHASEVFMQSKNWTTGTLLQYMRTMSLPVDKVRQDATFDKYIKDIEAVVGGADGVFDVGWTLALMLATRGS